MDEHVPIQLANLSDAPAAQLGSRVQLPPDEDGVETRPLAGSFSLPRVDGGKDAWFFLAAAFMSEALVWGKLPGFSLVVSRETARESCLTAVSRVCFLVRSLPRLLQQP